MWTEFCAHTHNFAKNSSLTLVSWNIGGDQAMEQLLVFLNRGRCFFALTLLPRSMRSALRTGVFGCSNHKLRGHNKSQKLGSTSSLHLLLYLFEAHIPSKR